MSLFDSASLVVTPNGVKEGKLYSIKPTDGSGDLSVTRATTATRVNSAGLVEVVPYNFITYSEQFQNSDWIGGGNGKPTMTDNFALAPNGTMTASKMEAISDGYQLRQNNAQENTQMNLSVWLRTNTGTKTIQLFLNNANTASQNITVTSTWTRYEISGLVTTLVGSGRNGLNTLEALTSSNYILVWGFQLVEGTSAKDYYPTTTRLNIPRLDYTNGSCPSILVEPQRTNIALYSEDFTNATWLLYSSGTGVNPIVTGNTTISPSGVQNADTIVLNSGAGTTPSDQSSIYQPFLITSGNVYTFSFYAKGVIGGEQIMVRQAGGASYTKLTLTNQWQRYEVTETATLTGISYLEIIIRRGLNEPMNTSATFAIWGAQLEVGSYPTSYIPTTSASVTRNADVISKTGISSLIGQTEGSAFVDINLDLSFTQDDMRFITISDGSSSNWYFIGTNVSNQIRFYFRAGNTTYVSELVTLTSGRHKLAFAYKNNDYVAYVDGVQIYSTASLSVGSTTSFDLCKSFGGSGVSKQFINSAILWKERLTNEQLAQLTTI